MNIVVLALYKLNQVCIHDCWMMAVKQSWMIGVEAESKLHCKKCDRPLRCKCHKLTEDQCNCLAVNIFIIWESSSYSFISQSFRYQHHNIANEQLLTCTYTRTLTNH